MQHTKTYLAIRFTVRLAVFMTFALALTFAASVISNMIDLLA